VIKTKDLQKLLLALAKTPKLPVLYNNINKNTIAYITKFQSLVHFGDKINH